MAHLYNSDHSLNVPEALARLEFWLQGLLPYNAPVRLLLSELKKNFPQEEQTR